MFAAFLYLLTSLVLVSSSTVTRIVWLEWADMTLGVVYALLGALAGWNAARVEE